MTVMIVALATAVWLFVAFLCVALARAAARSDVAVRRAVAAETVRRTAAKQEPLIHGLA